MGNCVDKGDSNAGADGKGAKGIASLLDAEHEFNGKADAGRVVCKILADKKFEISEFEGEGEEAKTSWKGDIKEADGVYTFDCGEEGTTSDKKIFTPELLESGNLKFDHKFVGDLEELTPVGEAKAAVEEEKAAE